MDSINSLLIIASAFSVFGQYLDNSHNHEIDKLKKELSGLDLSDANHDDGLSMIKLRWDDFMNKDCLRAKPFVAVLFVYLIAIVFCVTLTNGLCFFVEFSGSQMRSMDRFITMLFGGVLLVISLLMTFRLMAMMKQRIKRAEAAEEINNLYQPVRASIDSRKAAHQTAAAGQ